MPNQNNNFDEDVAYLIGMGRAGVPNSTVLDSSKSTFKRLLSYRKLLESLSSSFAEEDLHYLIKGFVQYDKLYSKEGYGFGGSVAPAIVLCKAYILRFPVKEKDLMSWVIDNRVNPYLPYGEFMSIDD